VRSLLVLGIAFLGSLLGSMSGGSSSALTMPAWLALGVPLPTAVATDKLAGTVWTLLGARNYLHGRTVDRRLLLGMLVPGLIAAWLGAAFTVRLDAALLKHFVGGMILLLIGVMLARPRLGAAPHPPHLSRAAMGVAAVPLGFYEGLLGSGNGLVASILFCWGRGFDILGALGHYYILAFAWSGLAAASYLSHGYYDVALMVPATIGASAGGVLGSRMARIRGTAFVRTLFVVVGSALGLKLLLGL
jgi:uncharacterized membrane protein YfcA